MTAEIVKGFKDISGEEAIKREKIKKILVDTFELYSFEPAETPVIEYEEFVKGNNSNDQAVSDIFKLKDRGERKLALRYEFTFQLKRLAQNKKLPYKRYQIGPVFRDEPTGTNRFRQFISCDADIIGSTIKDEAEIFSMIQEITKKLGVKSTFYVNNRKLLNEIFNSLKIKVSDKEQVLREIDKLDKLPESEIRQNLKKFNAEEVLDILKNKNEFFKRFESYKEIEELKEYCKLYNIELEFCPFLARGLSYYTGTIFEIKTKEIKETIFGGGAYNFNNINSFGFGVSLERLLSVSKLIILNKQVLIISLDQDKKSIEIAEFLRKNNISSSIFYGKPSKALEYANSKSISKVIFIGENEIKSKKYKLKEMVSGKEFILSEKEIVKKLLL
ncbi:MAG TPA: HisS family protein [Candidatus Paceibacterota bacterium]|nr:HisS family protein [Candidatus Paceibacterota bacterium]